MEDKILTKGQFNYCVNDIASDVVREKMKVLDKKISGIKFLFRPKTWEAWRILAYEFSDLVNMSKGMRECLSEEELKECYKIRHELSMIGWVKRDPNLLDQDWYWEKVV
jgi:hypothetical protein